MLLKVEHLCAGYGLIIAVRDLTLEVKEGELVSLIGANGAGKTTTLKTLAGLIQPVEGSIHFKGKPLHTVPAHQRVHEGLVLSPEGRGIFTRLTVAENLELGAYTRSDVAGIAQDIEKSYQMFPRLKERRWQIAGTLSGGEQQMLALARALMTRPRLLMLDEPSMGLAPLVVEQIFLAIIEVARGGVAILLVEQNARLALQVSQRAYVMEHGQIVLQGKSSELADNPQIQEAYLGGSR